jgi:hypothetical protein
MTVEPRDGKVVVADGGRDTETTTNKNARFELVTFGAFALCKKKNRRVNGRAR